MRFFEKRIVINFYKSYNNLIILALVLSRVNWTCLITIGT